ncbi:MAG: hypothetical protein IJN40_00675 [Clostridia bacterium]|nr:hypothetical protein [Clostridia bacterium]
MFPSQTFSKSAEDTYDFFVDASEHFNLYSLNLDNIIFDITATFNSFIRIITGEIKDTLYYLLQDFSGVFFIILIISIADSFLSSATLGKTVNLSGYIICSFFICKAFECVADIGVQSVHNIREYMNISFPAYISILSGMGYGGSSIVMKSVYLIFSNISAILVDEFIIPMLYFSAILSVSSGISGLSEIKKLSKTIIKTSRFVIGVLLIVFSAVISFSGFVASASDGVLIKTAKLAVTSFVPLVGNCLSETINSLISTTALLKNMAGYIGMIVILMIVLKPLIRFMIISVVFRLLSLLSSFITDGDFSEVFDVCSDVLSIYGSILIFLYIIYTLMFGIIITAGV